MAKKKCQKKKQTNKKTVNKRTACSSCSVGWSAQFLMAEFASI